MTTIFERVETALGTITPAVPFAMAPYEGTLPDQYVVHQLITSPAEEHADNVETARSYTVQVTIWSKSGLVAIPDVDTAMIAAGFGSSEALGLLSTLDKQTPDLFQRYRVTLLTDQALVYARLGDVEQSAPLLVEAVRRNHQVCSAEKATRIEAVRTLLTRTGGGSAVKVLDESLDAAEGAEPSPGLPADGR